MEAPDSFTIDISIFSFRLLFSINLFRNASDSLEAVPFPNATISKPYCLYIESNIFSASFSFPIVGYIIVVFITSPCLLINANLQPFLNPGSNPSICLFFNGGSSNNCFRFLENKTKEESSAFVVKSEIISFSTDGLINLL